MAVLFQKVVGEILKEGVPRTPSLHPYQFGTIFEGLIS
jgi:hypothetical protein